MILTLINKIRETDDVWSFIFESNSPISWQAGQFLEYKLPHDNEDGRGEKRWFTISAAPSEGNVRFTTRFVKEQSSSFKTALQDMEVGATITANGLEGDFVFEDPLRDHLFIAGGIGITPYRSILVEQDALGLPIKARLLYSNRDENFVFKKMLEEIALRNPGFTVNYIVKPQVIDKTLIQNELIRLSNPLVYISGPEPMVEAFEKSLKELGVEDKDIKTDFFPGYPVD